MSGARGCGSKIYLFLSVGRDKNINKKKKENANEDF